PARRAAAGSGPAAAGQARGGRDRPHPRGAGGGRPACLEGLPRRRLSELDSVHTFAEIAPAHGSDAMSRGEHPTGDRRIAWQNVLTVFSAAILIGAQVFDAAFAGVVAG